MALFTKGLIGAGIAGTVVLGTMVTWDGGTSVNSAKDKITEAATQIGVFKQNETALVSKVTSLKNEKATLTAEVATLKVELQAEKDKGVADKARITELEAEIAAKNAQIAELETEIATLNTDLENSAGNTAETVERINALEAELNAANEQAEELQYTLDTTVFESPDQAAVNAALEPTDGEVIVPIGPDPELGETQIPGSLNVTMASLTSPFPLLMNGGSLEVALERSADGTISLKSNSETKTYTATINGTTTALTFDYVSYGNIVDLDKHNLVITSNTGTVTNFWLTNN